MSRAKKWWALIEDVLAGTFLTLGILLILYGVVMRYVFNDPKSWVVEISTYLIVWGVLFGTPIALRNNNHIQINFLYDRLPKAYKRYVDIFANIVGVLFCFFFTYYGYQLVVGSFSSGMVSLDVGIELWIVYLVLPIAGFMFLLRFIERLMHSIRWVGE
ncbi:TRAP transporter small permease [Salipaludibacillus daqingensis]|uniref:TRAP transporter small permease n=1 Tax=Salipaludibacillus daqingensis TaxID=3041001 RepID=UPI00247695D9|nr:TRAP transporter small permease [Salipaludibacillus daqingensis]